VVGRPIAQAADPSRAAAEFVQAIEEALSTRGPAVPDPEA
jgi:hypothetical protein